MKKVWPWIFGILIGLFIFALLFYGGSSRQAYRIARGAVEERVTLTQDRIDAVEDMAIAAVDLALELSRDLPSQQAQADLVKQDIEEISNRLKEAAEARGDAAIEKLDQSIEQFDQTLQTVEDASNEATVPAVKSILDRIYGILEATKEQIVQTILNTQK
jgi:methyl-accepting chemotaxis protein